MARPKVARMVAILAAVAVVLCNAAAQSRDRDRPTRIESNELHGELIGGGDERFYSFVAGPGEVRITVDVRSFDGTAALNFELLDKDASDKILCCEFAQADSTGESGRNIKSVKLGRRQTVVLSLAPGSTGRGTFRVRLGGAVMLKGADEDR